MFRSVCLLLVRVFIQKFCAFGNQIDTALSNSSGKRMAELMRGDEAEGQLIPFESWKNKVTKVIGPAPTGNETENNTKIICEYSDKPEKPAISSLDIMIDPTHFSMKVLSNDELMKNPSPERSSRCINFDFHIIKISNMSQEIILPFDHVIQMN